MTKRYIFSYYWLDPSEGSSAFVADLSYEEFCRVERIINQLNAVPESGTTLVHWTIEEDEAGVIGGLNYKHTIQELIMHSRYNETEETGEYYGFKVNEFEDFLTSTD